MPRMTITKCFVLIRPDGEIERLNSPEDYQRALELADSSPEFQIEQRDLLELLPD